MNSQPIPEKVDLSVPQSPSPERSEDKYAISSKKNGKTIAVVLAALAITLTSLALVAIIAVGLHSHIVNEKTSEEITSLQNQINQLAGNLTKVRQELLVVTKSQSAQLGAQISDLAESYTGVSNGLQQEQETVDALHTQMGLVKYQLEHKIDNEVHALESKQNTTSANLITAFGQVENLKEELYNLTQRVNSSVGIYDKCVREQVSCTIHREQDRFWRVCSTPFVPMEVKNYQTIKTQCHYTSLYKGHQVATSLHKDFDNKVRCRCSFTSPNVNEPYFFTLPSSLRATCYLTTVRCPLKQQLFIESE